MKITVDDSVTGVDVFNGNKRKTIFVYAGDRPNHKWSTITIQEENIGNCVSIHTFPNNGKAEKTGPGYTGEQIVIGIPKNMLKEGVVSDKLVHFGKHAAAPAKI